MNSPTPASTTGDLFFSIPPPGGESPYYYIYQDADTGKRRSNVDLAPHRVTIENFRGSKDATLDTVGFQLIPRPSNHKSFNDSAEIKREYYPESVELLKEVTGGSKVVIFNHVVRRHQPGDLDAGGKRQPLSYVHVDQTTATAIAHVHENLPSAEVPDLLSRRWQLINLWRPIGHPALDWPLALCDYRSVDKENDPFAVQLFAPDHEGGTTIRFKYSADQKWKYFHGITPEESLLIKCYDSKEDPGVAVFAPHTGFDDLNMPAGTPPRESIELRALVFHD